ncbi:hypothetical protein [Adhaeribacter soli]|uniref:Glycosyltransferase RgtA/B/C/D-like domain-containing protein n=1 Tax=Adhaeribacter soli TaxID=2607655 RepID=A0A5N1IP71_9BACT|nr:hypothetical protein [Adhaeribacter soli]KAA9331814.1 hypothetical protein F0P94_13505 [Adhaeribacter soli]
MLKVLSTPNKGKETNSKAIRLTLETFWPALFFLLILLLGIFIFPHYGISTDERIDYLTGLVNARYVVETISPEALSKIPYLAQVPELSTYSDRHYGVFFQLPASILPHLFGFSDVRDIYLFRHFFTFLFYFGALLAFYKILQQRFLNWRIALLGSLMLVLSPRIFADAFFNSKDIVFLALMAGGWYTLNNLRKHFTYKWAILHAIITAAALDTRIMALSLLALSGLWLAHELFYATSNRKRLQIFRCGIVFTLFLAGFTILFWPYLWSAPLAHFLEVFEKLDRGGSTFDVLYWGEFIPYHTLPWHYIPTWLIITTPLLYSLLFLPGLLAIVARAFRQKLAFIHKEENKQDLSALFFFFFPLAIVIYTNAILYDGWRHMFFIYIPFLYLAMLGMVRLYSWLYANNRNLWQARSGQLLIACVLVGLGHTAWKMIQMHPHQNVYFSFMQPKFVVKNFERDYWGLSYRKALEYILRTDPRKEIPIAVNVYSGINASDILYPEQRSRLKFVITHEADYFLTEYRWQRNFYPTWEEIFTVKPAGLKIMSVYKLK